MIGYTNKDKVEYYEMLISGDYNGLTHAHMVDILENRLYKELALDYSRIIFAELQHSKDEMDYFIENLEFDEVRPIHIVFKTYGTEEEHIYYLGKESGVRLTGLEKDVYLDFFVDYISRVNIYINNFYMYSNVTQDDEFLEYQTYLIFLKRIINHYVGKEETLELIKLFRDNTIRRLEKEKRTDKEIEKYMAMYHIHADAV